MVSKRFCGQLVELARRHILLDLPISRSAVKFGKPPAANRAEEALRAFGVAK